MRPKFGLISYRVPDMRNVSILNLKCKNIKQLALERGLELHLRFGPKAPDTSIADRGASAIDSPRRASRPALAQSFQKVVAEAVAKGLFGSSSGRRRPKQKVLFISYPVELGTSLFGGLEPNVDFAYVPVDAKQSLIGKPILRLQVGSLFGDPSSPPENCFVRQT